jgi:hypothetical protein
MPLVHAGTLEAASCARVAGIKNHDKVFSPVRLVVTTQMYGDLVTETKQDAFVSRGKQYPKWSAQIVVACTFMLMYYLHEVPGSIDGNGCAWYYR